MKSTTNEPAEQATQLNDLPAKRSGQPVGTAKFVTKLMHYSAPLHSYQKMEDVIAELDRANQSGAPVVDEEGICVGVLTRSDIDRYRQLKQRYEERDETVIDEIFETDEFGQRRAGNCNFDLVCKHVTCPAVTVASTDSVDTAKLQFDQNTNIHRLVVVDQWNHPIGILEKQDLNSTSQRIDSRQVNSI